MKRHLAGLSLALAGIAMLAALFVLAAQPVSGVSAYSNGPSAAQYPSYGTAYAPKESGGSAKVLGASAAIGQTESTDGALRTISKDGTAGAYCPLKHTAVQAEISGFLARVTVTQEFVNPTSDRIEAIYTFPLPNNAAVDDMTMHVGERVVKGLIKRREEAQKIYDDAKIKGHTAALLDQERPNIFTQSVANIPAHAPVKVVISYVETLKYEAGVYEFVYPMVVGPRYIPGSPTGRQAGGWSPDTTQVPDASRITPPVAGVHVGQKGSRAGHDISLALKLDAGLPVQSLKSVTHEIDVQQPAARSAIVKLRNEKEIPNRDFVLRYDVSGMKIEDALLTHARGAQPDAKGGGMDAATGKGFFTFILQPPDGVSDEDATSRELIFVLDTSGSMSGYPIETAKKVMRRAIQNMRAGDTFNLITFAGDTHVLFPEPVIASADNIRTAVQFLDGRRGGGGTEMMKAIRIALGESGNGVADCKPWEDCAARPQRAGDAVRIVCFMTDGYVGNDMAIIGEVQKHADARVFSFGIGSSVNRFLLDGMARAGRGEVEYVLRAEDADPAADRFYERVHTPVLTDISIDWGKLAVSDVIPAKPLDLFTAKPLMLSGRYIEPGSGTITLRGKRAGKPFERAIRVELPRQQAENQALAQLWARSRIEQLMAADWEGMQSGQPRSDVREQVTQLGLDYRLMTQFTSFVAVEEQTVVEGGVTRTVHVPVEMPHNVSVEGVFGADVQQLRAAKQSNLALYSASPVSPGFVGRGSAGGVGGGVFKTAPATAASEPIVSKDGKRDRDEAERRKDEKHRQTLESKLHPALLAGFDCWKAGGKNCAGVKNGRVSIQIWLAKQTPQLTQELANLGFTSASAPKGVGASKLQLFGEIELTKLQQLAELSEVKLVALRK